MVVETVNLSTLTFTGEHRIFESGGKAGTAEIVTISTPDGLQGEVAIQKFDNGDIHVRLTEFLTTPPPTYSHLNHNGTMTVQIRDDGKWVALMRALRPGGRDHATLNYVAWDELNALLGGDAKQWLTNLGFEIGTWQELNPKAGRFKESLAVAIEPEKANLLVLPWTLTRVIALMKKLGHAAVVDLG